MHDKLRGHFHRDLEEHELESLTLAVASGDSQRATEIVAAIELLDEASAGEKAREVAAALGYSLTAPVDEPWNEQDTTRMREGCIVLGIGLLLGVLAPPKLAAELAVLLVVAIAVALWIPMRRGADAPLLWFSGGVAAPCAVIAMIRGGWLKWAIAALVLLMALRIALLVAVRLAPVKRQATTLRGSMARGAMALYLTLPALVSFHLLDLGVEEDQARAILLCLYLLVQSVIAAFVAAAGSSSWRGLHEVMAVPIVGVAIDAILLKDLSGKEALYELALVYSLVPAAGLLGLGLYALAAIMRRNVGDSASLDGLARIRQALRGVAGSVALAAVVLLFVVLVALAGSGRILDELSQSGAIGSGARSSLVFFALVLWASLDLGLAVFRTLRGTSDRSGRLDNPIEPIGRAGGASRPPAGSGNAE